MNKDKIMQNRIIRFEIILNFALKQKDKYCTGSCNFGVLSIMLNLLKQKMRSRSRARKTLLRLLRHNSFNSGYDDQKHTFLPKIYPCEIISIWTATSVLLFDPRMSIFFLWRITLALGLEYKRNFDFYRPCWNDILIYRSTATGVKTVAEVTVRTEWRLPSAGRLCGRDPPSRCLLTAESQRRHGRRATRHSARQLFEKREPAHKRLFCRIVIFGGK